MLDGKEKGVATPLQSPQTETNITSNDSVPQEPYGLEVENKAKSNVLPSFPLDTMPKPIAAFIKETAECNA
ncbi:hypothetical protein V7075_22415, partial [Neobacillus drentensis]|uniref:hypothetical protein n=1 Tax=Neobacillus drentensis TaxID=220684 RepID=UPI002FFE0C4F